MSTICVVQLMSYAIAKVVVMVQSFNTPIFGFGALDSHNPFANRRKSPCEIGPQLVMHFKSLKYTL